MAAAASEPVSLRDLSSGLDLAAEEVRAAVEEAIALWAGRGEVKEEADSVSLSGHEPVPDASQEERARQLLAALRSQPFSPPALDGDDDLLSYLEDRGDIVWVGEGIVFAAEAYREMVERVVAHLRERRTVTLAQVRDLLGTSRKYAQALLEHMDEQRVTRRVGDERVLRGR